MTENRSKIMTEIIEWGKSIGFALIVGALVIVFARPSLIIGPSMEPTFEDRQLVLVEKVSYLIAPPHHEDVIVANTNLPLNNWMNKSVIKRIIGLPGDVIKIQDGAVYRNGEQLDEPYIKDDYTMGNSEWTVPEKSVFVMGDNRGNSNDSRGKDIGFIPFSDIKGRVYMRLFPFNNIKLF